MALLLVPPIAGAEETAGAGLVGRAGQWVTSAAGNWDTSEGRVTLSQQGTQVSGTIAKDNGRIQGTLRGEVLEGTWVEDYSAQRCATAAWDGRWVLGTLPVDVHERWEVLGCVELL